MLLFHPSGLPGSLALHAVHVKCRKNSHCFSTTQDALTHVIVWRMDATVQSGSVCEAWLDLCVPLARLTNHRFVLTPFIHPHIEMQLFWMMIVEIWKTNRKLVVVRKPLDIPPCTTHYHPSWQKRWCSSTILLAKGDTGKKAGVPFESCCCQLTIQRYKALFTGAAHSPVNGFVLCAHPEHCTGSNDAHCCQLWYKCARVRNRKNGNGLDCVLEVVFWSIQMQKKILN